MASCCAEAGSSDLRHSVVPQGWPPSSGHGLGRSAAPSSFTEDPGLAHRCSCCPHPSDGMRMLGVASTSRSHVTCGRFMLPGLCLPRATWGRVA